MYIIAIQTHIFVDFFVPQGCAYQCLEKTLQFGSGSVLPWLPSFNLLFKTSTIKKKICSPLGEWWIYHWLKFISQLQRCNGNGDSWIFKVMSGKFSCACSLKIQMCCYHFFCIIQFSESAIISSCGLRSSVFDQKFLKWVISIYETSSGMGY